MTSNTCLIFFVLIALVIISCKKPAVPEDHGNATWVKVITDSPIYFVDKIKEDDGNLYCAYSRIQGEFNSSSAILKVDAFGRFLERTDFGELIVHDFIFDEESNMITAVSAGPEVKILKVKSGSESYTDIGSCSTNGPGITANKVTGLNLLTTPQGDYHLSGTISLSTGNNNTIGFVMQISSDGMDCWKEYFVFDPGADIAITGSIGDMDDYILFGNIQYSSPDISSFFLARIDADGKTIWSKFYPTSSYEPPNSYSGYYCQTSEIIKGQDGYLYGAAFNVLYNTPGTSDQFPSNDDNSARIFQISLEGDILQTLKIKYGVQNEVAGLAEKKGGGLFIGMNPNKLGNFATVVAIPLLIFFRLSNSAA